MSVLRDPSLLTALDVCELLKISRPTLRKLESESLIKSVRIGRIVRYRRTDINAMIDSLTVHERRSG